MKDIAPVYFNDERMFSLIDETDLAIIRMLQDNSRLQWKQIGEQIHMSGVAVANRVARLEELGIIEGYTVKVNERLLGNSLCCFVLVMIKDYKHTKFQEFVGQKEEIKEAHRVSGEPCFILRVEVPDHEKLAALLDEILVYGHYKLNVSIGKYK